jgi:hypothetical protein
MPRSLRNSEFLHDALDALRHGAPLREVELQFGINRKTLAVHARAAGIVVRAPGHPEVYPVHHEALDDVREPQQAWLLGLLTADGSVYERPNGIGAPIISLKVRAGDVTLLERVAAILGTSPTRIYHYEARVRDRAYPVAALAVSSRPLAGALARSGVVPRKSERTIYPWALPEHLQRYWLLGLFDGDGITAYQRADGTYGLNFGWCGSPGLMTTLAHLLPRRLGLGLTPCVSRNGFRWTCARVQWRARGDVERLVAYLYDSDGAALCLARKRDALLRALDRDRTSADDVA